MQDTVLFNDSIMHNIRYGCVTATDAKVFEAAKAACIHDTVTTRFPKVRLEREVQDSGFASQGTQHLRV